MRQNSLIPYSGRLSSEKTFVNFTVLWLYAKVFSVKFGHGVLWHCKSKQSAKIVFSPIHVFSLKSFPLYGNVGVVSGGGAHQNSPSSSTFSPILFFSFWGIWLHSLDLSRRERKRRKMRKTEKREEKKERERERKRKVTGREEGRKRKGSPSKEQA